VIQNESDSARVTGPTGGEVLATANLNSPTQVNPGGLGLFITTTQNLENVTIHRGHKPQQSSPGGPAGIQRYYELVPPNNGALNATLAFKYLDAELNGLTENSLSLFESDDRVNWKNQGFEIRNTTANFIQKNSIGTLGRFTLFNAAAPLPVHFISVTAHCQSGAVVVIWKTAQEQNIQHYSVEKSADGRNWNTVAQLPVKNNAAENTYTFLDNNPIQNAVYRISEQDLNGIVNYSTTVATSCATRDVVQVYPNPVTDKLFISIVAANNSTALIQLFDSKGALIKQQSEILLRTNNRFMIDVTNLAKGVYYMSVTWNNGQQKNTIRVVKQ
jgi:hypothetical protein